MTTIRCRKHDWRLLFNKPPRDASKEIGIEWFGLTITKGRDRYQICSQCGCLGVKNERIRMRGHEEEIKAEAEAWNRKVPDGSN